MSLKTGRPPKIRVYDFRRPDKFSKEQIRTLEMIHESLARMLSTSLSAHLRTMVRVEVAGVQQLPYGEFLERIGEPAVLAVVAVEPLGGRAVMEMDHAIAFPMLDRVLGGTGRTPGERRALTDIEVTVTERIVGTFFFQALREAWANLIHLEPSLHSIESSPMFTQIVGPSEMSINILFRIALAEREGLLQFCLPFLLLEPVAPKLSARHWFALERSGGHQDMVGMELERVALDLWVRLGTARITLAEVLRLEVGDVIQLDRLSGEMLELFVVDRPRFLVQPGRRGRRLAVSVREVLDAEEWGEEA